MTDLTAERNLNRLACEEGGSPNLAAVLLGVLAARLSAAEWDDALAVAKSSA